MKQGRLRAPLFLADGNKSERSCSKVKELRAWLTLLRLPRIGNAARLELLSQHHTAQAALAALASGQHPADSSIQNAARRPDRRVESDLQWLGAAPNRRLLTLGDPDYPALLARISDPPAALFVEGDVSLLWHAQVAIVGSRNATPGGLDLGRSFAATFAQTGLVVTSGLALGMDGVAHSGALDVGGGSVAVLGSGLDRIYPPQHEALAARLRAQGCLVSEFVPGSPPRPEHFPRRNRIISGLSLGVLVVEASLGSGSLITARVAAEQGREVFAVPGSVHNPMARGCHALIKGGAKLVETAREVIEELGPLARELGAALQFRLSSPAGPAQRPLQQASAPRDEHAAASAREDERVLSAMGYDPVALDHLVERTGLSVPELSSILLRLELDGVVDSMGGARYQRRS
jgi:DNA processing protein